MVELVVFDWKRTLYNPDDRELMGGALDVLRSLGAKGLKLFLVGKDQDGSMPSEVSRLDVSTYFQGIHFTKESKTDDDISQFIDPDYPELAVVVGDRVRSEIEIGNRLGLTTVWVRNGKFAQEVPQHPLQIPDNTIGEISELITLVDTL